MRGMNAPTYPALGYSACPHDCPSTCALEVEIVDARLLDDRTVLLELDEVQPVMQMEITYSIKASDGAATRQTIYNTINAVPEG